MTGQIVEIGKDSSRLRAFVSLPNEVYRGDPFYCAPSVETLKFELCSWAPMGTQHIFLALEDGAPVGRCVARTNCGLRDEYGNPLGMVGFFEVLERRDAACAMLNEAVAALKRDGCRRVLGPMDGDTWHTYRMNLGPREPHPFLKEPYNPAYYPLFWEDAGFRPFEGYYSVRVPDVTPVVARFGRVYARLVKYGYRFRQIELARFDEELDLLYELSCDIFRDNLLYTDIPRDRFRSLYEGVRPLLDSGLVWFAYEPSGSPAGFVFAFRDRFHAVCAMRGRRGLRARLGFCVNKCRADAVNVKTLGVVEEHRRSGLGLALVFEAYRSALKLGLRRANLCLIREGNPSGRIDGGLGGTLRR